MKGAADVRLSTCCNATMTLNICDACNKMNEGWETPSPEEMLLVVQRRLTELEESRHGTDPQVATRIIGCVLGHMAEDLPLELGSPFAALLLDYARYLRQTGLA